jgi:mannitol-1-phosphate 5-dehydrogenase
LNAVIFGAGNIGRGLVGAVLAEAGYRLTFVDVNTELVAALRQAGSYGVIAGSDRVTVPVHDALDAGDEARVGAAVAAADLVATAVGSPILEIVARPIAAGLTARGNGDMNVLACENVHPNSEVLRAHVAAIVGVGQLGSVGFPNVTVDRIVPGNPGALDVVVEPSFEFVVDRNAWVGPLPPTSAIVFTTDLTAFRLRKLWLLNGLHVLVAWLGLQAGHQQIHSALTDPAVRRPVESAAATMVRALADRSDQFTPAELGDYAASSLRRFANSGLADACVRVARNPLSKLAPDERVMGPARAAEQLGLDLTGLAEGVAAALGLTDSTVEGIDDLRAAVEAHGPERFLVERCGLDPDGRLASEVRRLLTARRTRISEDILLSNPEGLHARPAAQIAERAQGLAASVQIRKGSKVANAASIMSLLALGAASGDTLTVIAEGAEAEAAMGVVRAIMTSTEH